MERYEYSHPYVPLGLASPEYRDGWERIWGRADGARRNVQQTQQDRGGHDHPPGDLPGRSDAVRPGCGCLPAFRS